MPSRQTQIPIERAVTLELGKLGLPVLLRYDIARTAWRLYKAGVYEGLPLATRRETVDARAFKRLEGGLQATGVLTPLQGVPSRSAYTLIGNTVSDRNAVVCALDPFCYLSHLTAMEFYGLTDRMPEQIYVSTPSSKEWTSFAEERMAKDLLEDFPEYKQSGLPVLRRTRIEKIGQRPIHRFASTHHGAYRTIKGSSIRVATIGRTFLDMLRNPELCGGLAHVLQAFREYARGNFRLICDELDQHGSPIDKVRAGFILEDICDIHDPRIDAWIEFAARGGSRKLDPAADYAPQFSERWMLSINTSLASD